MFKYFFHQSGDTNRFQMSLETRIWNLDALFSPTWILKLIMLKSQITHLILIINC